MCLVKFCVLLKDVSFQRIQTVFPRRSAGGGGALFAWRKQFMVRFVVAALSAHLLCLTATPVEVLISSWAMGISPMCT